MGDIVVVQSMSRFMFKPYKNKWLLHVYLSDIMVSSGNNDPLKWTLAPESKPAWKYTLYASMHYLTPSLNVLTNEKESFMRSI